jgi:hypothetical protein
MSHWYLLQKDEVEGPMTTDQVKAWASRNPQMHGQVMVWGKPQAEWRPLSWWLVEAPSLAEGRPHQRDDRLWHYAFQGKAVGPLTRPDLLTKLREIPLGPEVLLWTKGMAAWASVFEFQDVLNELGVNRRQHPRADIDGTIKISNATGASGTGKIVTISEGGLGLVESSLLLEVGQVYQAEIISDAFYDPVHVRLEIRYCTETGFVGCRFQNLSSEAKSAIVPYVRQSGKTVVRAA